MKTNQVVKCLSVFLFSFLVVIALSPVITGWWGFFGFVFDWLIDSVSGELDWALVIFLTL